MLTISLQSVKMIYIQHTKDKIDPDYFTCNIIECWYISTVGKDDLHTAHKTQDRFWLFHM
jgi:hypothetical protein